jgi:hypothetical protein
MPFKLGNLSGDKIYLGNTEVTKAYLGNQEVYSSGPPIIEYDWNWSIGTISFLPDYAETDGDNDIQGSSQVSIYIDPNITPHILSSASFEYGTEYSKALFFSDPPSSPNGIFNLEDYYDNGVLSGLSNNIAIPTNSADIVLRFIFNPNSGLSQTQIVNNLNSIWTVGLVLS